MVESTLDFLFVGYVYIHVSLMFCNYNTQNTIRLLNTTCQYVYLKIIKYNPWYIDTKKRTIILIDIINILLLLRESNLKSYLSCQNKKL